MSRPSKQSLRGLVLAVLVPCLLFSATVSGWVTYRSLYDIILNGGFEQKLNAISTAAAALVDPETHVELSTPRAPTALAADSGEPVLWAVDELSGQLLAIDPVNGEAAEVGPGPVGGVVALAVAPADAAAAAAPGADPVGPLVGALPDGRLMEIARDASGASEVGDIGPGVRDLAFAAGHLIVAREGALEGWRWPDGARREGGSPEWSTALDAVAVAALHADGRLFALDAEGTLQRVDPLTGGTEAVGELRALGEDGIELTGVSVRALTSSPFVSGLLAAGERLLRLDPESAELTLGDARRGYRSQSGPAYESYVAPLRRIRGPLDVTYLYSQNLVAGDSIQYVVDATPLGPDHSPIGTHEALESEADIQGIHNVQGRGMIYSSGIEDSEEWGLLKSAYAPIRRRDGSVVGMIGTDISVATIQDKTQLALARVGIVSILTLLLGGLGAIIISLRLTRPLAAVQKGASLVAAGRRADPIAPPSLRDLAALTTSFNEMTRVLTSSVDDLATERSQADADRGMRDLVESLEDDHLDGTVALDGPHRVRVQATDPEAAHLVTIPGPPEVGRLAVLAAVTPGVSRLARKVEARELRELLIRLLSIAPAEELAERAARVWAADAFPVVVVEVRTGTARAGGAAAATPGLWTAEVES